MGDSRFLVPRRNGSVVRSLARVYTGAFEGLPGTVWRLCIGLLLNRAGTMVLPFLSLYLVRKLGFDSGAAAGVLLSFGLGSVVGAYTGGTISARFSPLRVQIWSLIMAGVVFIGLGQLHAFESIVICVFVAGVVGDAYRPACMTSVVDAAPPEVRTRALGLMRLAANAGMAIGPAMGGLLAEIDYAWIFVGEAVTCWGAAVWLFSSLSGIDIRHETEPSASADERKPLLKDGSFWALLGLVFAATMVLFQIFSTFPLYLTAAYGLGERQIGLLFGLNAGMIVAAEMVLIRLLERRNAAVVLGVGMLLMCGGFGLLPFGSSVGFVVLTVVIWTIGEMLTFPFSNVLVAQRAGPGRTAQAMGMYAAVFSLALILAPVAGLGVYDRFGGESLWFAAGLLGLPLLAGALILARTGRKRSVEE